MKPTPHLWYEVLVLRMLALALAFAISVGFGWLVTDVLIGMADWLSALAATASAGGGIAP